jgi:hypothetical protein
MAGMPVRPTFLGGQPRYPRRIDQGGVRRPQRFGDQDGALRHGGEIAERRGGQVAQQPAAGFADFVGPPLPAGGIIAMQRQHRGGQCLGFLVHRRLGAHMRVANALAGLAQQPAAAEHLGIGVDQRRDFVLGIFRQNGKPGAQLAELLARQRHRIVQPPSFRLR